MTYFIQKEIEFDAGHRVPLHESKCKNPHGHRYRVVATIEGELITEGPESGMVRDFSIVKQLLTEKIHDVFDHAFVIASSDKSMLASFMVKPGPEGAWSELGFKIVVVPFYPTAECLAKHFHSLLVDDLPNLVEIAVWETPTSVAVYRNR